MSPLMFMLYMMFLLSILGFITNRIHLLSALLCLEGMMLALFMSLLLWGKQFNIIFFYPLPMFLLTFSACGASTGLALMVATTRMHSMDYLKNLHLLQC